MKRTFPTQPATHAPSVGGLPVLGAGLQIFRDPYGWWPRQYRRHGPAFRLRFPGYDFAWTALAGLEANELLAQRGHELFSQERTYPRGKEVLGTHLHPSITEGALQRHLRRQLAGGYTREAVRPHLRTMRAWVRDEVDRWSVGDRLNVTRTTGFLGLNCSSIFATGQPVDLDSEAVRRYATVYTGVVALNWPRIAMRIPSMARAREGLDSLIERRLAEHAEVPPGDARPPDYFDQVLAATMPDGSPLPQRAKVVWGQVPFKNMGVYAGRVINQVLYQIVHRPEVLERVRPEIDRVFSCEELTLEGIASMRATRATIKEALRVHPVAAALQRTTVQPFEFGGYRFEENDSVFFPISATHFLPEFFPEPERFDIDRFLGPNEGVPFSYNPFGVGHHSCVARAVFEAITVVVIGSVLHRWALAAPYRLRTIVDALPGPWPGHIMAVRGHRPRASASRAPARSGLETEGSQTAERCPVDRRE